MKLSKRSYYQFQKNMKNATYEQIRHDEYLSKEIKLKIVKSFVILYQMTFLHAYHVEIPM